MSYYVYILASQPNGTLYIGVTNNLIKRIWQHKNNLVEGFTKQYSVHTLVYFEQYNWINEALLREKQLKKWNRNWKIRLIKKNNPHWKDLYEKILYVDSRLRGNDKNMKKYHAIVLIIFLIGALLRFTNLNWDSYQAFHPDERNIAWAVTRIHWFDELNPKFFAYGGLPIYLYKILSDITAWATHDPSWTTDWGKIAVVGRYVSATLSSLSLPFIYLVGFRFFSPAVGVLAMFFLAFSPWAIREAHFATTETMLVFFLLLLLLVSYCHCERSEAIPLRLPRPLRGLAMTIGSGIILGLAIAAKTTSLLFLIIPLLSIWLSSHTIRHRISMTLILLFFSGAYFLLTSPYTIIDYPHFLESMKYETGVALGRFSVPYTLQFFRSIPYIYQLQTMLWQAGPVAIIGIVGIIMLTTNMVYMYIVSFPRKRESSFQKATKYWIPASAGMTTQKRMNVSSLLLFLIFPLIYGVWSGSWYAKFSRYTVPLLPFATLASAWLMVFLFQKLSKQKIYLYICIFVYLLIGVSHTLWGLMNWTIYLRPQTRIEASQWIYDHVPLGANLLTEHWNDGLPVDIHGGKNPSEYPRELLNVYDTDTDEKMRTLADQLVQADYIILSTRRMWGTLPRLSEKYPATSRFYTLLLSGQLGYTEVAVFTSYPSLFGIVINDDPAEESIQVFDHPTVRIFQNTRKLPKEEVEKKIKGS